LKFLKFRIEHLDLGNRPTSVVPHWQDRHNRYSSSILKHAAEKHNGWPRPCRLGQSTFSRRRSEWMVMNPHHVFLGLLVMAAGLLTVSVTTQLDDSAGIALLVFLGLASGHMALLAAWCVRGNQNWSLRLGSVAVLGAVLAAPLARSMAAPWSEWLAWLYLHALLVGLWLVITRQIGRWVAWPGPPATGGLRRTAGWYPFSLQGLFAVMVTVAIVLGVARQVSLSRDGWAAQLGYAASLAAVAVCCLQRSGIHQGRPARFLIPAAACLLAGWSMWMIEQAGTAWSFTSVAVVQALVVSIGAVAWDQSRKSLAASRSGT
jgi:hypothetical protein